MPNYPNSTQLGLSLVDKRLINRQRLRLTVINALVLAAIWTLLSATVYLALVQRTMGQVDTRLYTAMHRTKRLTEELGVLPGLTASAPPQGDDDDVQTAIWLRTESRFRLLEPASLPAVLRTALQAHLTREGTHMPLQTLSVGGIPYRLIERRLPGGAILQITENIRGEQDVLSDLLGLVTLAGLAGVALTVIGGYSLGLWTLRPFIAARRREQDLLSDVSHELKTPLTVMGTNLELLLRHTDGDDESQLRWLGSVYAENQRMRKMVEELLQLARLDAGLEQLEHTSVDLLDLCADVAMLYEPVATERGLSFVWQPPTTAVIVQGDPSRLRQILYILLDNACKYTRAGHISLTLQSDGHTVHLGVQDSGSGIPEDFLPQATERFARADHARKDRSSAGLGLAIANRLVDALGGKLYIHSQSGVGTEVLISLTTHE